MYATERTPLVQKSPSPQNVQHRKCISQALLLTIFLVLVAYSIYTSSVPSDGRQKSSKNILIQRADAIDEINIDLHPDDIYYLETLDRDSDEWKNHHHKVIARNGYDPFDKTVLFTFTMHDYHYDRNRYFYGNYLNAHLSTDDETHAIPTLRPTMEGGSHRPTATKTLKPTIYKTTRPTTRAGATFRPTEVKTPRPTTKRPTNTRRPTRFGETYSPTAAPTPAPTVVTAAPTLKPTHMPTTAAPTTALPTPVPVTSRPTTPVPTVRTAAPTLKPTHRPITPVPVTSRPTLSSKPTQIKTNKPTKKGKDGRPTLPPNSPRPTEDHNHTPRPTSLRPTQDQSVQSRHVANGGLLCYAKYSLNELVNTGGKRLSCSLPTHVLVGCVSGSTHRPKAERAGEQVKEDPIGCVAEGEALYIRCCIPQDPTVYMTGKITPIEYNEKYPVYSDQAWCHNTNVSMFNELSTAGITYYLTGCLAFFGVPGGFYDKNGNIVAREDTMCSRVTGTMIMAGGTGNCRAHRGDKKGFVAAPIIAVGLQKEYWLDCIEVVSGEAHTPKNSAVHGSQEVPEYAAMAFCWPGYSLMDCNGFIQGDIAKCGASFTRSEDRVRSVLFHGTDMKCMPDKEQHCSANGNTDKVRVQARCCKLRAKNDTDSPTSAGQITTKHPTFVYHHSPTLQPSPEPTTFGPTQPTHPTHPTPKPTGRDYTTTTTTTTSTTESHHGHGHQSHERKNRVKEEARNVYGTGKKGGNGRHVRDRGNALSVD